LVNHIPRALSVAPDLDDRAISIASHIEVALPNSSFKEHGFFLTKSPPPVDQIPDRHLSKGRACGSAQSERSGKKTLGLRSAAVA